MWSKKEENVMKMKKKYAFSVFGISCVMLFAVGIYGAKIMDKNGTNLKDLILSNFYNIEVSQTENDNQDNIDLSLAAGTPYVKPTTARNSINTTSGYSGLISDSERKCYTLIKANAHKILDSQPKPGLYSIEAIKILGCRLTAIQIKRVLYAIQIDNPGMFWISSTFTYCYSGNKTILKLNSNFSKEKQQIAMKNLTNKVNTILSQAPKNASDYEMELFFHDYIIKNCRYQKITSFKNINFNVFTSYGCLVENSAVCEGYSKAMQLLMNSVGIRCETVVGSREDEAHMWNIVKINDNWYHLDVTWDGAGNFQKYNYFNLTDEMIKKDHKINQELSNTINFDKNIRYNFKMPVCNSTAENYYEKNAVKVQNLNSQANNAIIKELIKSASSKNEYLYIKLDKNISLENAKKYLFSQASYKFFSCIKKANQSLPVNNKMNEQQVRYSENHIQNVLIIKLSYKN